MDEFFARYKKTAAGIPPENIWNYDETNLRDNPGAQKAIFKRGIKYAEEVRDHSNTDISVMFCASGTGVVMPPPTWSTRPSTSTIPGVAMA